jgi:hypothetical protein
MDDRDPTRPVDRDSALESVQRRLRQLTVAVVAMTLALFLTCAMVFGDRVSYFAGQASLYGGSLAGAAILGFLFGWFARGRR